jgi:RNA polymerase sporulation-specific sigma factor
VFALADVRFSDTTDDRLAGLAKEGDSDAFAELTARYMFLVRAKAAPFHLTQLEPEDLCQEGLVGLLNAAKSFDPAGRASFRTYAGICIENRIIMACRAALSRKNSPLSDFVSLSGEESPDFPQQGGKWDPEAMLTDSEGVNQMWRRIEEELSKLEFQVLKLYLSGYNYDEIAKKLSVTSKAADNALQRVRVKLKNRILCGS